MTRSYVYILIFTAAIFCLLPINNTVAERVIGASKSKASNGNSKVNQTLQQVIDEASNTATTRAEDGGSRLSSLSSQIVKIDDSGNVEVFLYCSEVSNENLAKLQALGLILEDMNSEHKVVHGWMPYENIEDAAEMGFVVKVKPPDYAHKRTGPVNSEGDAVLESDDARNILGADGTGVLIGVISDGVDSLAVSQATGELPSFVNVGSNAAGGDEGTAMLEIIHDIAPGADLAFHTAFPTSVQFLNAIDFFISIGADIIVDDIGFLTQPYFQDGELAQAAQAATEMGIAFFSAAGNDADRHYQAFYVDDGAFNSTLDLHDFGAAAGGGSNVGMTYEIPGGGTAAFFLQWSDPFGASSNDYDLLIVDTFTGETVAASEDVQDGNDDPIEFTSVQNMGFGSAFVDILIRKFSGTAQTLEIHFNLDGALTEFNVPTDAIFGHPAAPDVLATAAFDWKTPNTIESFSSHGPSSIISPSDAAISTRAAISELRAKPEFAGPDGVSTSVPGFTTFFGTSAAAPHAAAVGALVLQAINFQASQTSANPTAATRNAQAIETALTSTAVDLGQPGFDNISGFGRINAFAAVNSILQGNPIPTPSGNPPPTPTQVSGPNTGGGGGCSLQGPIAGSMLNAAILNLIVLFAPAIVFGASIMIKRRKEKKT